MKKVFVLISCVAVVFILCNVSIAQSDNAQSESVPAPAPEVPQLSVDNIVGEVQPGGGTVWRQLRPAPRALPFGVPPYPTVDGYPAFGVPYSYPRAPRRLGARFAPPQILPQPLPVPGAVPGAVELPVPPVVAPPMAMGQLPARHGVLGISQLTPVVEVPPTVIYRPTPIKNFVTLMTAPRPYIGYDPYAGYPPFPGYIPPQ